MSTIFSQDNIYLYVLLYTYAFLSIYAFLKSLLDIRLVFFFFPFPSLLWVIFLEVQSTRSEHVNLS